MCLGQEENTFECLKMKNLCCLVSYYIAYLLCYIAYVIKIRNKYDGPYKHVPNQQRARSSQLSQHNLQLTILFGKMDLTSFTTTGVLANQTIFLVQKID